MHLKTEIQAALARTFRRPGFGVASHGGPSITFASMKHAREHGAAVRSLAAGACAQVG